MTGYNAILESVEKLLQEAGDNIIMPAWNSSLNITTKSDGSNVTETDLACQQLIESRLQQLYPDIGFLGEEMEPEIQLACLHGEHRYWCVDPLDGTSNFIAGVPAFAASLALIEHGHPVIACIYDPVRKECFSAIKGESARLNDSTLTIHNDSALADAVGYIDFKRLPAEVAIRFATEKIYRSQRNIGTCALEWAWLAAGRGQFIVHGGQKLWDFSAGSLLASEAGCRVGDFKGETLFPCETLTSPVVAAANPAIQTSLLEQL